MSRMTYPLLNRHLGRVHRARRHAFNLCGSIVGVPDAPIAKALSRASIRSPSTESRQRDSGVSLYLLTRLYSLHTIVFVSPLDPHPKPLTFKSFSLYLPATITPTP